METVYKYRIDHRTAYLTAILLVCFLLLGGALYLLYEGGYLSAWFTSFVIALIALLSLSIPRKLVVTPDKVEIRCLLDLTEIPRSEIASVRRCDTRELRWTLPLFGWSGFFGYYGHFLDLKRLEHITIYASEWHNFVEITDIYDERYYVSCREADALVTLLTTKKTLVSEPSSTQTMTSDIS